MRKIILDYLHYLEIGSYEDLIKLFAPNAIVHSPLYGDKNATNFYQKLFADTQQSKIKLINILENHENKTAAAQFQYDWTLSNGVEAPFEVVDMFQFNETHQITSLKIIYDTWSTRNKLNIWPNGTHVAQVRVARPTQKLNEILRFYVEGLGLSITDSFKDHDGYDGVMLGLPEHQYHLEFTQHRDIAPCTAPTRDNLLVFYFENHAEITQLKQSLESLGYSPVAPENQYWADKSITFEDPEGWRVVLCQLL